MIVSLEIRRDDGQGTFPFSNVEVIDVTVQSTTFMDGNNKVTILNSDIVRVWAPRKDAHNPSAKHNDWLIWQEAPPVYRVLQTIWNEGKVWEWDK